MSSTLRLRRGSNSAPAERAAPEKRERPKLLSNLRLKLGIVILAIFVIGSFTLPLFTAVDPSQQGTYFKNLPVSGQHLLGTNALGQDIFWFLVFAIRNSLLLGVITSIGITIISTLVGLSAGYIGGWYERLIMLVIDAFITIPVLPILIILSTLVRGNTSFLIVGVILIVFGWAWGARTVRSMALSLREREFVNVARFSGASTFRIIVHEIFPYVYAYTVVHFINTILFAINTEAALAVIGLSKVEVPTLGSILFWALNYNALFSGQITWLIGPIVATVLLFLGLFLVSTGYNEFSATRRGVA
ncbi:peptide ABC transporter [Reticulibacter mediterranei]|uniref:Peptide ABC transporter n=1 Tax=Reticulibacter mediterranei TaxID=2778369 RepID=A0A8J3IWF1_9CHLR|nr:ABC transporter permease [Reticulibacter mediterranei]GHO99109.1 peptide ABC transporter [Reticulibacter mediterranei]